MSLNGKHGGGVETQKKQKGTKKTNGAGADDGDEVATWEAAGSKHRWMLFFPVLVDALLGRISGGCGLYRRPTGDEDE